MAMNELVGRLHAALDALTDIGPDVSSGEPWPLGDGVGPGPESTWGPKEVLAHVSEMLPFWMGEIELIIDADVVPREDGAGGEDAPGAATPEPPAFGRLEADALRVGVIERDRRFPSRELLARIEVEGRRVAQRLAELDAREVEMLGRHPTRGDLSTTDIAERLIVGHLEGHVAQLRETLAAR
jgi:hypothetical protein